MARFTGVSGVIATSHRDTSGQIHGHTYRVKGWFIYDGQDAAALRQRWLRMLARYDHIVLHHSIARAEDLAFRIGEGFEGCIAVEIDRPDEGFHARWDRD